MTEQMNTYFTLFDDAIVGELVDATGADAFTARFMLALDRGLAGDATFSRPLVDDVMFPHLLDARVSFSASDALEIIDTPVSIRGGTTVLWRRDAVAGLRTG
jgi:hypothetical protein